MARFALNNKKANNYAFFCPVSRLHLTRSNPIGMTDGVTPAILRGLRSGVILDLDNVVDLKKGVLKAATVPPQDPPPSDPNNGGQQEGEPKNEAPKKRGRQKKNEANTAQPTEPTEPAESSEPTEPVEDTEGSEQAGE